MRSSVFLQHCLLGVMLAILAVTLLYPIGLTIRGGFADDIVTGEGFTLRHVALVFRDPVLREGLVNAFLIATFTTLLCVLIGLPLAVLAARYQYPLKGVWNAAILVPLILPPFVGAVGMKAIFGRDGALNALLGTEWDVLGEARFWGVVVALALHLYPIIYLNATAALANLDPALDQAGQICGAGAIKRFVSITLPLIRPGLFAGGAIVYIWSFTELGTPLMFDYYNVTSVQIFNGIKEVNASAQPFALTFVLLAFSVLFYLIGKTVLGKPGHASSLRAFSSGGERKLKPLPGAMASLAFALVCFLAVTPHLGVIFTSLAPPGGWRGTVLPTEWTLDNYHNALRHPLAFGSISNSLMLATAASVLNIIVGIAIGYLLVRTRVYGRTLLDSLAMLPLAVPGLVMAFGYVAITLRWPFGRGDPLEGWIDVVGSNPNPIPLLIIAYAVRRLPYIVRATVAGLEQIGVEMEEAASIFGARTMRKLRLVVIPLIAANLMAGGLLVFSFSMLEVSDSLILAQQERHYPITKAIYTFSYRLGDGMAIASSMGVWGMLLLGVTLIGASVMMGKSLGAVFRA